MKKFLTLALSIVAFIGTVSAQVFHEGIPSFAEKLFAMNKTAAKVHLIQHEMKIYTKADLLNLAYNPDSIDYWVVGMGPDQIGCKVRYKDLNGKPEKVQVVGVEYINFGYIVNEYLSAKYELIDNQPRNKMLLFRRVTDRYIYGAAVYY